MNTTRVPTDQEWRELVEAADAFRKDACWRWVSDADTFGIEDPATRTTVYCSIMGALGKHFALSCYLGPDGLWSLERMKLSDETGQCDTFDAFCSQRCLTVMFVDKKEVEKKDRDLLRRLGFEFKGKSSWPVFREFVPGYPPLDLDASKAILFTKVIEQTRDVAHRARVQEGLLEPREDRLMLIRAPVVKNGKVVEWRDSWEKPTAYPACIEEVPEYERSTLKEHARRLTTLPDGWEVDFFYSTSLVKEGDGAFRPVVMLCVSSKSGAVIGVDLTRIEDVAFDFPEFLLKMFEKTGVKPRAVRTRKPEARTLVELLAKDMGFAVVDRRRLRHLEEACEHILDFMEDSP